jgi:hypothetical protein
MKAEIRDNMLADSEVERFIHRVNFVSERGRRDRRDRGERERATTRIIRFERERVIEKIED